MRNVHNLPDGLDGGSQGHIDAHRTIHEALKNPSEFSTGWRDLAGLSAVTAGICKAIRIGSHVTISLVDAKFDIAGGNTIFTLPAGWRPSQDTYFESIDYWAADTKRAGRILTTGAVQFQGLTADDLIRVDFTFPTTQAKPTIYPGTPA